MRVRVTRRFGRVLVATIVLVAAALVLTPRTRAASKIDGLWEAVITSGGGPNASPIDIPFRFEIATDGDKATGFFFEGDRKIGSTSGTFADGALKLEYDFLNTTLELTLSGDNLKGTYKNNSRPRGQDVTMRRFLPMAMGDVQAPQVAGNWEMRRVKEEETAPRDTRTWHLYLRQSGAELSGSILRVDGDVGTLVGHWDAGKLTMSHFAGERPNLLEATPN